MRWLWQRVWLIAPLVVFVLLASWYSLAIPLGEGPDEPGHAEYAFWLARTGRLPNVTAGEVVGEGHQPPLAYWLYEPFAWLAPADQRTVQLRLNPQWSWNGGGEVAAFGQRSLDRWPFYDDALAWHAMRGVSVLWGITTLLLIAWVGNRLGLAKNSIGIGLGLLAVWPQILFHFALVSNDPLLWVCCTGVLGILLDPAPKRWWGIQCGLVLGAALLVKQSAILLIPLVGLGWWCLRERLSHPWRQLIMMGAATLAVAGWWYARNIALYGDIFGLGAYQQTFMTEPFDPFNGTAWRGGLSALGASSVARFGWMNLDPPWWIWIGGGACIGLGLVGLIGLWRRRQTISPHRWMPRRALIVVALPILAFAWTVAFAVLSGQVAWQGRFIFPAIGALALGLGMGLARFPRWGTGLLIGWMLIGNLWMLARAIPQTYTTPTIAPQAATPLIARWKPDHTPAFELRVIDLSLLELRPGQQFTISTVWHATGSQDRNWSQFWHLAQPEAEAEALSVNVQPAFPASRWTRGDWWRDSVTITVPPDLPSGTYEVRLGWFDEFGTSERVGLRDQEGVLQGDYAVVAVISIVE